MNSKFVTRAASVAVFAGSIALVTANQPRVDLAQIRQTLNSVPRLELPAKAATLAVTAQGEDRLAQVKAIVETAVDLNPVAAPAIVSSVAKLSPDAAATAAVAAAAKQPKQTRAIVKAATTAAPSQALKIVSAFCKEQPTTYQAVAVTVAESVPGMDQAIINSVMASLPTLKPFYTRATEAFRKGAIATPTVAAFMNQVSRDVANSARALNIDEGVLMAAGLTPAQQGALPASPIMQPSFTGYTGTPGEINRNQTAELNPAGGRSESAP